MSGKSRREFLGQAWRAALALPVATHVPWAALLSGGSAPDAEAALPMRRWQRNRERMIAGTLWAWGKNDYGQLAQGNTTHRSSPVQVGTLKSWSSISASNHSLAIRSDGTLWGWGGNYYGSLGQNDVVSRSSPTQIGSDSNWMNICASCDNSTHAIKNDGTLWVWGFNGIGQLGLGDVTRRSSPIQMGSQSAWARVSGTLMNNAANLLRADGTLWTLGNNFYGELGLGDTVNRSSPTQVGGLNSWAQVSTGDTFTLGIRSDGTLWAWGGGNPSNNFGQLGVGDTIDRSSPVQVGSLSNWVEVSCGQLHTMAIRSDGTLWAWGMGGAGQLGLGDTISRSSPVQVGTLSQWVHVVCSTGSTFALRADGTLWAWGANSFGELGLGDTLGRSSPTQVGSLKTWVQLAAGQNHVLAIRNG